MYKKKSIPLSLKALVWNKYIGHIISERNGGSTTLNNLIPLCQTCNLSMGRQNMNDFVKKYGFHDELDNSLPKRTINKTKKKLLNNNINNAIVIKDNETSSDEMNHNEINYNTKNNFTNSSNLDYEDCQTINFLTMYFNTKKNKF